MEQPTSTNPKDAVIQAKKFLASTSAKAITAYNNLLIVSKLKLFFEKSFYSKQLEKTQIRIWIYKMLEYKMKKYAEDKMGDFKLEDEDTQKRRLAAKKEASQLLNEICKRTINDYQNYTHRLLHRVILIQARFKGYLYRLINKMEMMNLKISRENERAKEKAKAAARQRRESKRK